MSEWSGGHALLVLRRTSGNPTLAQLLGLVPYIVRFNTAGIRAYTCKFILCHMSDE